MARSYQVALPLELAFWWWNVPNSVTNAGQEVGMCFRTTITDGKDDPVMAVFRKGHANVNKSAG